MKKFELGPRHTLAIVSYIAASMGYSKEDIKRIVGNMVKIDIIDDFHKILVEPLDKVKQINNPVQKGTIDLVIPFNLAERIQKVIDLILEKIDNSYLSSCQELRTATIVYKNSPLRFDNFIRNPNEETKEDPKMKAEPKMTAREEYDEERLEELVKQRVEEELQKRENLEKERRDEALREAMDETVRGLKGKEVEIPNFKPAPDVASNEDSNGSGQSGYFKTQLNIFGRPNPQMGSNFVPVPHAYWSSKHIVNEIDEINQVIDNLVSFRDRLIAKLGHAQFKEKEQPKEPQEPKEQSEQDSKVDWDVIKEPPEQFEPMYRPNIN